MRRSILIGIPHAGGFQVLAGPDQPTEQVREQFREITKTFAADREHPELARLELWDSSGGVTKSVRFAEPIAPASEEGETAPAKKAASPRSKNPRNRRRS